MSSILRKLRTKFMLMTTGIVTILVVIIAVTYCITAYSSIKAETERTLDHAIAASTTGQVRIPHYIQGFELIDDRFGRPPSDTSPDQASPSGQSDNPGSGERGAEGATASGNGGSELTDDQRIDLYHGQSALVYSVVVDGSGNILRNFSPAIDLDEAVLTEAVEYVIGQPGFSLEDGRVTSGRIASANLLFEAKVQGGEIHLALTDASSLDSRMREAIGGSGALAGIALVLTVAISFFLARLFLKPVEEAWSKQRRFVADASHELKTPLTVIMANTEIVRSAPDETVASQMKWLDGTMGESERMHGLIADLLLLARMDDEQGTGTPSFSEQVDLSEAVECTVVGFEAVAFERDLTIRESLEEGIFVDGIRSRLIRLPDILVDNACKYAEQGGVVEIDLRRTEGKAVFCVFNTGPEIPEKDLGQIFDRFYRADESRSSDIPGYGLGLSIAQSIVEESGGTIEAKNIPGKGVAFIVSLPLSTSENKVKSTTSS